ncbi:hypothetical protein UFOVP53_185 [uncultured Caudovirales phage]|uniref:Uncharacterized protein n=1 Tax=uncultured Caudovirales phage TaxID=2100421 RepID=A0A6J5KX73_9CAUD|nr:hypothetical protein UFOVP53_185 [uncultured Caudovirales phage]
MQLTLYQKHLLTEVSIKAMKILGLPILEVKFEPYMLGFNNAAINSNAYTRTLVFSSVLAKSSNTYADWYQLIAHELIHHKQMEEGRLRTEFGAFDRRMYWEDKDVTEILFAAWDDRDGDSYFVLPWEQEANLSQEGIGMMLKDKIKVDFDKTPSLIYRIKKLIKSKLSRAVA